MQSNHLPSETKGRGRGGWGRGRDAKITAALIVVTLRQRVNSVSEDVTHDRADGVRNVSRVLSRSTFSLPGGFDRWGNLSKLCWEIHQEGDRPGDTGCRNPGLCCHPSADFGIYCGSQRSNKRHKYAKKPKASTLSTPLPRQCQVAETPDELLDLTSRHAFLPCRKS